jgi:hypothetical protein
MVPIQFAHVPSRSKPARKRAFVWLAIATALSTLGAATVLMALCTN